MLLASMTSSQFHEWMVYHSIEPFGEFRAELRHGQQMAMTANLNRDTKKKRDPFTTAEFMNFVEQPEKKIEPLDPARVDREVFGL